MRHPHAITLPAIRVDAIAAAINDGLDGYSDRYQPRPSGCGRAYVCLSVRDRKMTTAWRKAIELLGMRYLPKNYKAGDRALYVGYDNGTGVPLAMAKSIADSVNRILPNLVYWDTADD